MSYKDLQESRRGAIEVLRRNLHGEPQKPQPRQQVSRPRFEATTSRLQIREHYFQTNIFGKTVLYRDFERAKHVLARYLTGGTKTCNILFFSKSKSSQTFSELSSAHENIVSFTLRSPLRPSVGCMAVGNVARNLQQVPLNLFSHFGGSFLTIDFLNCSPISVHLLQSDANFHNFSSVFFLKKMQVY